MRHAILTCLALAVLVLVGRQAGVAAESTDPAADVKRTAETILGGGGPEEVEKAVHHLLDVLARIGTDGKLPEPFRTRVDAVRTAASGMLNPKSVDTLREAYAAVNGGKPFVMPSDLDSLEALTAHGRRRAGRAADALTKARSEEAARELLGFILLVVTPVEAGTAPVAG